MHWVSSNKNSFTLSHTNSYLFGIILLETISFILEHNLGNRLYFSFFSKKNTKTKLDSLINLESKLIEKENKKEIFKQTKYGKHTNDNLVE